MQTLIRIAICAVLAAPLSAVVNGLLSDGALSFKLDTTFAIGFFLASIIGLLVAGIPLHQSQPSAAANDSGKSKPAGRSSAKGKGKGKKQTGEVKWFNGSKGFGFITCDNGDEIFVHFRSVLKDSKRLSPGKRVEFVVVQGKKGAEAEQVMVV